MDREVRRVPPNWSHPKHEEAWRAERGDLQPMYNQRYEDAAEEWMREFDAFRADPKAQADAAKYGNKYFWDWHGMPPDEAYYRTYSDEEATWFQLYETVSEGTPVSPPFATKEELAAYLAANGDFWDQKRGHGGWGKERADAFVADGWAPSMVVTNGRVLESKDIPLALKNERRDGNPR